MVYWYLRERGMVGGEKKTGKAERRPRRWWSSRESSVTGSSLASQRHNSLCFDRSSLRRDYQIMELKEVRRSSSGQSTGALAKPISRLHFTATKQTDKAATYPIEEKRCTGKGWPGPRHWSCKAQRYDPTFRFQLLQKVCLQQACSCRTIEATARYRARSNTPLLLRWVPTRRPQRLPRYC